MKQLPKMYKNNIIMPKNHNQKTYSLKNSKIQNNVEEELNDIFNSFSSLYNQKVEIITNNKTYNTILLSRTNHYVMTNNKEFIPIKEIKSIKKIIR